MVSADLISQHSLEPGDCNHDRAAVHEVVPSRGLLFRETSAQPVLCKPKLMPLQSISLEKFGAPAGSTEDSATAAPQESLVPQTQINKWPGFY
uniref:Uncharacterized protein n=1 Tax=Rhipicephalus microplus TaxID=6941 RepID=A0A6M2D3Z7_RHIMP